ncbi:MAG: hypothetical protein JWR37_5737 [Mycobacterium sp.]|nr:hypothetical protein [Mycobacterium sp.]
MTGSAGQDRLGVSDVGRRPGQGLGDELGPVSAEVGGGCECLNSVLQQDTGRARGAGGWSLLDNDVCSPT